jgi:hypothetical protein
MRREEEMRALRFRLIVAAILTADLRGRNGRHLIPSSITGR